MPASRDRAGFGRRGLLLGGLLLPNLARAQQDWPARPIRLIVPYAAGGTTDVLARLVSDGVARRLGQPIVIENRGGAGATIGAAAVAQAPPDGHTLVMSNSGSHGVSPHIYRNAGYDPLQDFVHVGLVGRTPHVLLVTASHPARTLQDFIAAARRQGELRFAVAGIGASSHLLGVRLGVVTGIPVEAVAYRGAGPAANDVIAGTLPAMFDSVPSAAGHVRGGQLRPLAVSGEQRSPIMPEVPTLVESGVEIVSTSWFGISAPRGLPDAIARRLSGAILDTLRDPETGRRLAQLGADAPLMTPEAYTRFIREELAAWGAVVRAAGIEAI